MRVLSSLSLVAAVATGVQAAIVSLQPFSSTYHAASTSRLSVTFQTAPTFIVRNDYSIALGVYSASSGFSDPQIGALWANVDLVARGQSSTGGQNVTISNLALPASAFTSGSGSYKIVAAVTFGNGPGLSTGVEFFSQPLNVTV